MPWRPCHQATAQSLQSRMRQDVETQLGKPGRSNPTITRCCHKCAKASWGLCQISAAYVQKTARLRDKADLLVNEINIYASTETLHLKQGLKNFVDDFAKRRDY